MPRMSTVQAGTTIGIDMGKNTLHMIGLDSRGAIVLREKVSRGRVALRLANLPPCLIGIEAGLATHYVARELAALGHDVKQVVNRLPNLTPYRLPILTPLSGVAWRQRSSRRSWPGLRRRDERVLRDRRRGF